jgi:hypothetical protein
MNRQLLTPPASSATTSSTSSCSWLALLASAEMVSTIPAASAAHLQTHT